MTNEIDFEAIAVVALEISDRVKLISKLVPKEKEILIKDVAAMVIHLGFFMHALVNEQGFHEDTFDPALKKKFLDKCGCKNETGI